MNRTVTIMDFWQQLADKNWEALSFYFMEDAKIYWPNTSEEFAVSDFVEVNRYYPGNWTILVIECYEAESVLVSVTKVSDSETSFHALSFFFFEGDKISSLREYWSQDAPAPLWRGNHYVKSNYEK